MTLHVVYSASARNHLHSIYDFITERAGPAIARRYTKQIEQACARLCNFPMRGTPRNDIRPGLRMTSRKRRVVIFYSIEPSRVIVHGIFYGGQDYQTILRKNDA